MKPEIKDAIDRYAKDHIPTGGFLKAVLSNNLQESFGRADDSNIQDMFEIVSYCYNEIPNMCWGSLKIVEKWLDSKE